MFTTKDANRGLEIMLIVLAIGTTVLFLLLGGFKMVALNLFYLPIVLSGYFLGRSSAGVLSLFCVLSVTIATTLDPVGFAAYTSPVMIYLALAVWAGALGLTAILVGTLCDARAAKVAELHEAYLGVVEVLSHYLQGGGDRTQASNNPIVELGQAVGREMRLPEKEIDDIRIGVLLYDLGSIEITTRLIDKAVTALSGNPKVVSKHTFQGMDLVHSLASIVHGVAPLLASQHDDICQALIGDSNTASGPLTAQIIRAVRTYDGLIRNSPPELRLTPSRAVEELRENPDHGFDPDVLRALERVAMRAVAFAQPEPVGL